MKKRIFISMHYMEIGGAERALLGLLNAIDTSIVDVDLFINQHTGPFMKLIPDKINLLPEMRGYNAIERPLKQILIEGQFKIAFARLKAKIKYRQYIRNNKLEHKEEGSGSHYIMDEVIPYLPSLYYLGEYDLAIAFLDPPHIIQKKVLARKRIEWIHTDWGTITTDYSKLYHWWAGNDYIASISPEITKSFLKAFPGLDDKIVLIENILSPRMVIEQSNACRAKEMEGNNGVTLLSIGRISYPKNFEIIPYVCRCLIDKGMNNFKWFILGQGNHEEIDKTVIKLKVEDYIIFLGARENPYPYIKACDIYLQPSRYEGKSVTVREAQILQKPVIITNYPTSSSQITHRLDGIISEMAPKEIANAIIELLQDTDLKDHIISYLQNHDYGNESEINKLYQIIGCR